MIKVQLTVIHPMDGTEIPIEAESDATAGTCAEEFTFHLRLRRFQGKGIVLQRPQL